MVWAVVFSFISFPWFCIMSGLVLGPVKINSVIMSIVVGFCICISMFSSLSYSVSEWGRIKRGFLKLNNAGMSIISGCIIVVLSKKHTINPHITWYKQLFDFNRTF